MNTGDYFYSPYVGCSATTVGRELPRNKSKTGIYSPKIAQEMIENNIPMLGKTTIYKFIHQDKENGDNLYKHTRHQLKHGSRALYTYKKEVEDKKSIDERPAIISQKTEFGHREIDLIVGAGNKGAILTMVEISNKMLFMRKLKKGIMAKPLANELIDMMLPYKHCIKTITCDNGREFSDFKRIEKKLGIQIYFAHP